MIAGVVLVVVVGLVEAGPQGATRPVPVSAHNCYPANSKSNARLVEALRLGVDNIEIDLGWDEANRRLIVGHDASPRAGVVYPEFESYLIPALEEHWKAPRADGAPTVLTIDWKTANADAVQALKAFLDRHADWFSSAPKTKSSLLNPRRLTVCFTGSDEAKETYDRLVAPGAEYRAFRDTVFGSGEYKENVTDYARHPASAYHRFLTFHWGVVERGGPPLAGDWTSDEATRLSALVAHAHAQGFRVRFYCLNGHTGPRVSPYRFANDAAAAVRWHAGAQAGVDWLASDEYAEIAKALRGVRKQ